MSRARERDDVSYVINEDCSVKNVLSILKIRRSSIMALYLPSNIVVVRFVYRFLELFHPPEKRRELSSLDFSGDHKKGTRRRRQQLINDINNFYKYSTCWRQRALLSRTIKCHKIYDTPNKRPLARTVAATSSAIGSIVARDCVIKDERGGIEELNINVRERWDEEKRPSLMMMTIERRPDDDIYYEISWVLMKKSWPAVSKDVDGSVLLLYERRWQIINLRQRTRDRHDNRTCRIWIWRILLFNFVCCSFLQNHRDTRHNLFLFHYSILIKFSRSFSFSMLECSSFSALVSFFFCDW